MKKGIWILLSIFLFSLASCVNQPKIVKKESPTGEWVWINQELYNKANLGEITDKELEYGFIIAKSTCKIESLKVPIPSPSCYVIPAPNCSGLVGFALGMCRGKRPREQCDRSAMYAAEDAKSQIFNACMRIEGWERIWKKFPVSTTPELNKSKTLNPPREKTNGS